MTKVNSILIAMLNWSELKNVWFLPQNCKTAYNDASKSVERFVQTKAALANVDTILPIQAIKPHTTKASLFHLGSFWLGVIAFNHVNTCWLVSRGFIVVNLKNLQFLKMISSARQKKKRFFINFFTKIYSNIGFLHSWFIFIYTFPLN